MPVHQFETVLKGLKKYPGIRHRDLSMIIQGYKEPRGYLHLFRNFHERVRDWSLNDGRCRAKDFL